MICVAKQDLKKKPKDELVDALYNSLIEIEKLKRELRKYKNPNTPSSAHKHLKPNTRGLMIKRSARRGAPKGHPGTTRRWAPDTCEAIDTDICPGCNSEDVGDDKVLKRTTEEMP